MNEFQPIQPKILVVDDESIVVSLVRDALEDDDYLVETAGTPAEALDWVKRQHFDLIITDIRMPGMDGIEMVKRAHEDQPDMGVIFMTGYANLSSAKNAIKQGAYDYIMKPFELNEIRQAVRNAIKTRREFAAKSSEQELSRLSDLSQMLFTSNDRGSLITSSLKFIMMHQQSTCGSVLLLDMENDQCLEVTIRGNEQQQTTRPLNQAIMSVVHNDSMNLHQPFVVERIDNHPLFIVNPSPEMKELLASSWGDDNQSNIIIPITRNNTLYGWFTLETTDDTTQIKDADSKFLVITASQLAMTLENLFLLEETQKAYANLKELQDETIHLEKIAARGEMSAEIGHEMNNFIGVVAGNLSLLEFHLNKGNTGDLAKYIEAMSGTIEKIKTFTSNLMDLTPISSEKTVLSFDKLLCEVIEFVKPQKRFRGIQVQVQNMPKDIPFEADNTQMQQLLYNLFNNAADAMVDSQTKEIIVHVEMLSNDTQFRFTITDTGCGFAPELLQKAFQERFTTKKLGHGFGLVVCKRIIENHGGNLRVDSIPMERTSIIIDFPLCQQELARV
jgi:signal transduction histidine kinase/CheY-like chemotaxis protein